MHQESSLSHARTDSAQRSAALSIDALTTQRPGAEPPIQGARPERAAYLRGVQRRAQGPLPAALPLDALLTAPAAAGPSPSEQALAAGPAVQRQAAPGGGSAGIEVTAQAGSMLPPLGYMGPLGPYGPLGTLGPVGNNTWNPSAYISGAGSSGWSGLSEQLTHMGGPLSEAGPLGPSGPLGHLHDGAVMPSMQPGGEAAVLGPLGPLGALGPLGPLGPIGAHGYKADAAGNYRGPDGKVVRDVGVPYQGGTRQYELFESYTSDQAKKMKDNDTSFMVTGAVEQGQSDTFSFTAKSAEYVTILLTPEKQLDTFELIVLDENNKVVADNKGGAQVDWVQVKVPAGTRLKAKVKLLSHLHFLSPSYRLIVTGSGPYAKE